jgi:hypothetical protein
VRFSDAIRFRAPRAAIELARYPFAPSQFQESWTDEYTNVQSFPNTFMIDFIVKFSISGVRPARDLYLMFSRE